VSDAVVVAVEFALIVVTTKAAMLVTTVRLPAPSYWSRFGC
jgi:hypothetical protein